MRAVRTAALLAGFLLAAGLPNGQASERITVNDGLLSVELKDVALGRVLTRIALDAGFEADVGSNVYVKTVSTEFSGVEIQKGLRRLLELAGQKSFVIHYAPDGSIRKLEVYEAGATAGSARPAPSSRPPARGVSRPGGRANPFAPTRVPRQAVPQSPSPSQMEGPAEEPPPFEEGPQSEPPPFESPGEPLGEPPPFEPQGGPGGGG